MADENEPRILVKPSQRFQQTDDTRLHFDHHLAAGRTRRRARVVPILPARVAVQLVERLAGPFAAIDLLQRLHVVDGAPGFLGDDVGRAASALQWARQNAQRLQGGEPPAGRARLLLSRRVQRHAGHPAAQHAVDEIVFAMTHEVERRAHSAFLFRTLDEALDADARFVIAELDWRRLHEIARRSGQGAADAAFQARSWRNARRRSRRRRNSASRRLQASVPH